jgi:Secretion system C-terminal sorting domain
MKLKLFFIYILLSFICAEISAQTPVNHGCYWPPYSPSRTVDSLPRHRDSTSEDWWYNIAVVPPGHATYDTGGRYICAGYSMFDDIGTGLIYTNDPCNHPYSTNSFLPPPDSANFGLPDMRHMNACGTIGLVNLTRTSSGSNPFKWIYHYGRGTIFSKVIPTSDGGFLATGRSSAFNLPYPSIEFQFSNFQNLANAPQPIYYQYPRNVTGSTYGINPFSFTSCPTAHSAMYPPEETAGRVTVKSHACLAKVDSSGKLLWMYQYGAVPFDTAASGIIAYKNSSMGTDLVEIPGGYLMAGIMQNSVLNGTLGNHGVLMKVDTDGKLIWMREYYDADSSRSKFMAMSLKNDSIAYVVGERTLMGSSFDGGYPYSSSYLNGENYAHKEHHQNSRFLPFLKKINISTGAQVWDFALETTTALDHKVRSVDINTNDDILVPVSTECFLPFAAGECKNSYVNVITDNGGSATSTQKVFFGPVRAYDLDLGLGVKATTDGGFIVVGTKKPYNLLVNKNYRASPFGSGYNMGSVSQTYTETDGFVAKANSSGNIEWTSLFDNTTRTPGGNFRSNAGNPRDQVNLDSFMNHRENRSKRDIKRQECFYAITTSADGEIIIGGNMSANIDDSYMAMIDNTCNLTMSNHLIQSLVPVSGADRITNMNNFIATTINTGRTPGDTNEVAAFIVNDMAQIKITAGEEITMYEGTDLDDSTDIEASINSSHTCTAGPVNAFNSYTPSFSRNTFVKDKKTLLPVAVKPQVIASPNPTTGLITIKHPAEIKYLEVFDLYGKKIFEVRANSSGQTKIDFTNTSAGMYLIKIEGISQAIKIMKN